MPSKDWTELVLDNRKEPLLRGSGKLGRMPKTKKLMAALPVSGISVEEQRAQMLTTYPKRSCWLAWRGLCEVEGHV